MVLRCPRSDDDSSGPLRRRQPFWKEHPSLWRGLRRLRLPEIGNKTPATVVRGDARPCSQSEGPAVLPALAGRSRGEARMWHSRPRLYGNCQREPPTEERRQPRAGCPHNRPRDRRLRFFVLDDFGEPADLRADAFEVRVQPQRASEAFQRGDVVAQMEIRLAHARCRAEVVRVDLQRLVAIADGFDVAAQTELRGRSLVPRFGEPAGVLDQFGRPVGRPRGIAARRSGG